MSDIKTNLNAIRQRITLAEQRYHREPGSVKLLAVTKTQSVALIEDAVAIGQQFFAENYLQEALPKIKYLSEFDLEWHFIGPIQSNKTKGIAENFQWVHSVDRFKIAERLQRQRPLYLPPLQICLQVNVDNDPAKAGLKLNELADLAQQLKQFSRLQLRGLMTILAENKTNDQIMESYSRLRIAFEELQQKGFQLDTLSMGMSADFEPAIAAGSTCVRIGSAIFGERV
jgi:pyridoxal phosphate enzyme (YggS family)